MAFQAQGGQESQNRRNILQDLQQKRQLLLNQGQGSAANVGTNLSAMRAAGTDPSTSFKPHEATVIRSPADPSLSQRQALEVSWRTYSNIYRKKEKKNGTEEINVEVIHVLFC
ncbi:PREDICTED: SOSS complex subunit C homolog [Acropora digitifera]|uniref:SOSS complex subunit C homolog n=1 Tax=Acropora digitifera TaxID=70779 RepID=UPI000779F2DF|nr:PREDICTED: SOSS complex subunit C homolog [Acropora digitifera]